MQTAILAGPAISHVAQTIQLALAPVFLLTGIGAFLNLCAGRLARIIDRSRVVSAQVLRTVGPEHDQLIWEIRLIDRRMRIVNRAILFGVLSACMICLVVILLFGSEIGRVDLGKPIALLFMGAMASLAGAFGLFILEVRLAARAIKVSADILFHQAESRN